MAILLFDETNALFRKRTEICNFHDKYTNILPEYLAPGVYVEEYKIGPKPIEGVSTSTAGFLGETERGPIKPRLVTSFAEYARIYGSYLKHSFLPFAVDGFFKNGGKRCYIGRIVGNNAQPASITLGGNDDALMQVKALGEGTWGNRVWIKIKNATSHDTDNSLFQLQIKYFRPEKEHTVVKNKTPPDFEEIFDDLSPEPISSGYYEKAVNGVSNFVVLEDKSQGRPTNTPKDDNDTTPWEKVLNFGTDGGAIVTDDYKGKFVEDADIKTGLEGLADIEDISIISIPDSVDGDGLSKLLKTHCETLKDCFAILNLEQNAVNNLGTVKPEDGSKYTGLYTPWLKILNPLTGKEMLIPPAGHVAGIYARNDIQRGVHKAPANELVRGIMSLPAQITKEQQAVLNPKGVNVIKSFPGRGSVVWGARTTTLEPKWKYINITRLFIFIEKSIKRSTQWVVFEPNNERLWARISATISQFLHGVWRTGALMGTTAEEAFFVRCDRTTMTPDDIDNGRLVSIIGLAPTKPAEFVIIRLIQTKAGAEVEEL